MKKNIIMIIATLLLTSCVGNMLYGDKIDAGLIKNNQMSLVATKVSVLSKDVFNKSHTFSGYIVIQDIHNSNLKYKIDGKSYNDSLTMVQPGKYSITEYGYIDGGFTFHTEQFTDIDPFKHGIIDIKSGNCVYLGDINVKKENNHIININVSGKNINILSNMLKDSDAAEFAHKFVFYKTKNSIKQKNQR